MTIGFLIASRRRKLSAEEQAALEWLRSEKRYKMRILTAEDLVASRNSLRDLDVIWWHYASSLKLPACVRQKQVIDSLRFFLERGGGLLLSLLAAQYIVDLQLESRPPNAVIAGRWNEDPWTQTWHDMKGFHSWNLLDINGHPIFDGLFGGVYTWSPLKGEKFWKVDYAGEVLPMNGRVVGVARGLISLDESSRLILEYNLGKGKVLTIGSFLFFDAQRNFYREHLEQFMLHCLKYLLGRKSGTKPYYWPFERRSTVYFRCNCPKLEVVHQPLPSVRSGLELRRTPASSAFTDTGGRRLLVTAEERGGLTEVWSHPIRLLSGLEVGFLIDGTRLVWSKDLPCSFAIRPEAFIREYRLDETTVVRETVFSALDDPGVLLHYSIDTAKDVELIVTFSVDLRPMWPKSEAAIGSLFYSWDEGLHGAIVEDKTRTFCAVFGAGVEPEEYLLGRFSAVEFKGDRLHGIPTDDVRVAVGVRYALRGSSFALAVAGGMDGSSNTFALYKRLLQRTASYYRQQVRYYKDLLNQSTMVQTPDEQFNEAYRWALVGMDRFYVRTPHLGESLMAGYGNTKPGWEVSRPGYAWYFGRDSVWTAFAMLAYGDFAKVRAVLEFLGRFQEFTGKIFHELTTSATVHFDAADSTPLYLILMGQYLRVTDDAAFVRRQWDRIERAMQFCSATDTDGDGLIEDTDVGHGWVEGGKLFGAHVEIYLAALWCEALKQCSFVTKRLRRSRQARTWERKAGTVHRLLEKKFSNGETGWYHFGLFRDGTFNPEKTVMPAVPCCFHLLERGRSKQMLQEIWRGGFTSPWGVRIVSKDSALYDPTGYHLGSVWPLFTGWASLAEYRYRLPEQGFAHLCMNLNLYKDFSLGYLPEVLHGEEYKPAGVCLHQAWSHSMAIQPLLQGMVGLDVDAAKGIVKLDPQLPNSWNRVSVRNVKVGNLTLHVYLEQIAKGLRFTLRGSGNRIMLKFIRPRPRS